MRGLALYGLIPGLLTLMFGSLGIAGAVKRKGDCAKCMVGGHIATSLLVFILCIIGALVALVTSVCALNCSYTKPNVLSQHLSL
jgi:hypothetical protein